MNYQRKYSYGLLIMQVCVCSFMKSVHSASLSTHALQAAAATTDMPSASHIRWPEHYNRTFNLSFWPSDLDNPSRTGRNVIKNRCVQDTPDCPYNNTSLINRMLRQADTNSRSISPWVWVRDYNPYRFPSTVYVACCVCRHCVHLSTGKKLAGFYSENVATRSMVGYYNTATRRTEERIEEFVVGCTCAPARNG